MIQHIFSHVYIRALITVNSINKEVHIHKICMTVSPLGSWQFLNSKAKSCIWWVAWLPVQPNCVLCRNTCAVPTCSIIKRESKSTQFNLFSHGYYECWKRHRHRNLFLLPPSIPSLSLSSPWMRIRESNLALCYKSTTLRLSTLERKSPFV